MFNQVDGQPGRSGRVRRNLRHEKLGCAEALRYKKMGAACFTFFVSVRVLTLVGREPDENKFVMRGVENLPPCAALCFILAADDVKFHEVRCAADK